MAPTTRARRPADTITKPQISTSTSRDSASSLPDQIDNDDPDNTKAERRLQRYKSWTPEPRGEEESLAWARKHLGERWCDLHEAHQREKDHLKDPLKYYNMLQEMSRIEGKKRREHEREKKAALGDAYTPNWFIPLDRSDSCSVSPPPVDIDDHDSCEPCDSDRNIDEADSQQHTLWTPEPEPYDAKKYKVWGRKHYGSDWYEQRETMLQERNFYQFINARDDPHYQRRQEALRKMEREREQERLPLRKGKSWQELMAWARMHYGEAWWKQREALDQDEREEREELDPDRRKKISSQAAKRWLILREMQWERDEGMLAEGKTWHEIMAWPIEASNVLPSVETGGDIVSSPSSSERSDHSGYSTYPPTPTDTRRLAMDGPQGPDHRMKWRWERLEWDAVRSGLSETAYEEKRIQMLATIRSWREDEECERRNRAELAAIKDLKFSLATQGRYNIETAKRERRMRNLDRRLMGWTQEQIDAKDRDEDAHQKELSAIHLARLEKLASGEPQRKPLTQEEMDARPGVTSQPQASPTPQTKDASRKTRGGRINKNMTENQSVVSKSTRSQRSAPTTARAPTIGRRRNRSKRAPDVLEELGDNAPRAPLPPRRRLHKTHEKERASRRLAGQPPEFGELPGRGEAPSRYEISLPQPSNTHKPSRSGPHIRGSKPTIVKGARPQGISKSRQDGVGRRRRSTK